MTDLAGIMHFSNFFRMMEVTEHAFFRSLGFSISLEDEGRKYGFPRVHVACDYKVALRFEDELDVQLLVREKRSKSLTYEFYFWKQQGEETLLAAKGAITAVCVAMDHESGKMKAVNIPANLASKIEIAPQNSP